MGHEQQQRVHPARVPLRGEQAQRVGRAIDPQIVAVDREEGIAVDQRRRLDQPATGLEQLRALVGDGDVEIRAATQMGFERVGEIVDVDHRTLDPGRAQAVEDMVEERLAGDFDQRLGTGCGQRAHSRAQPGGHDHRGARHVGGDVCADGEGAGHAHAPGRRFSGGT